MAIDVTLAERNKVHGAFENNADIAQQLKAVLRYGTNFDRLSAVHAQALEAIMDKTSRILAGDPDFPDHWHDIQGYAKLAENGCKQQPL